MVSEFNGWKENALVREGLNKLASKFASTDHLGPKFVADFQELIFDEDREVLIRDAYERMHYLLKGLGINE